MHGYRKLTVVFYSDHNQRKTYVLPFFLNIMQNSEHDITGLNSGHDITGLYDTSL